jgi:hypothetical protein
MRCGRVAGFCCAALTVELVVAARSDLMQAWRGTFVGLRSFLDPSVKLSGLNFA